MVVSTVLADVLGSVTIILGSSTIPVSYVEGAVVDIDLLSFPKTSIINVLNHFEKAQVAGNDIQ